MSLSPVAASPTKVCIARPDYNYTETFIDAHERLLPMETVTAWQGFLPRRFGQHGRILSPAQDLACRLAERSARTRGWARQRRLQAFRHFLKREGVEAVLAEFGPTGASIAPACAAARVPLVVHFHGFDANRETTVQTYREAYQELFRTATAVVVVSQPMREKLRALGAPEDKLHVIPCGVDTELFDGAHPEAMPPHFLAVGRFVEKKAPHLTVSAFARLRRTWPEARLTMVGDGPLLDATRQLARGLGVADGMDFQGAQPHATVGRLMQQARALVQHSVVAPDGDCEGTPVAVMEAQSSGLPVVSTEHAGIPDCVVDGKTGFLVPEYAVEATAERMLRLAQDPQLAGRMGRAGRERAKTHFDVRTSVQRLAELLGHRSGEGAPEDTDFEPRALSGWLKPAGA